MNKAVQERIAFLETGIEDQKMVILKLSKDLDDAKGLLISMKGGVLELKGFLNMEAIQKASKEIKDNEEEE